MLIFICPGSPPPLRCPVSCRVASRRVCLGVRIFCISIYLSTSMTNPSTYLLVGKHSIHHQLANQTNHLSIQGTIPSQKKLNWLMWIRTCSLFKAPLGEMKRKICHCSGTGSILMSFNLQLHFILIQLLLSKQIDKR